MAAVERTFGKPVSLLVDAKGFPDGRLVHFEIWKQAGQNKEKIADVDGVVKREKGVGQWEPSFKREPQLPLKDKINQQPQKEQYSFTAKIDDKSVQGTPIEFIYPLEIYIEDTSGVPLDNAKFSMTFSNGTKKQGTLKNGRFKFEGVPAGKFVVELEDYDFAFS